MLAAVLSGPNDLTAQEVPTPSPGPGEVLVKVGADTICGTDVRILRGEKTSGVRLPVVLGHETAGHVAEVAGRAACLRGQRAALVAGRGRRHRAGDGRGPIGLLHLQLGLGRGARAVIVSDPSQGRRANAERFGATVTVDPASQDLGAVVGEVSRGVGIDSTIVAIGRAELVNQAVGLARVGGRVNLFAGFKGKGLAEVESNLLHYKQVRLTGTSNARRADYETALRMIETGKVDTASMVTHRFPLRSVTEAIETVTTGQAIKVAVLP